MKIWLKSWIEDEEHEGSISAADLFAEIDDFDDIITDDSDSRNRAFTLSSS